MTLDWWTLGLQTINAAVLVWLLARFFWRPVAAMIEQRRALAQKGMDEVATAQAALAQDRAAIDATRAGFAAERAALLAAAQAEAARLTEAAQAEAHATAAAITAEAETRLQAEARAAAATWASRAHHLAIDIAAQLLARLPPDAAQDSFLEALATEAAALPAATRQSLAAGAPLEAVTPAPLDPVAQQRCQSRLAAAFGTPPRLTFRTDPALLAGIELHGPDFILRNSWRADLDRIAASLAHAEPT